MARGQPGPVQRAVAAPALAFLLIVALCAFAPRALAQTPPAPPGAAAAEAAAVDCGFTPDDYAEGVTDPVPLSPFCAVVKLTSTYQMYPADFFQQHALCPDQALKYTANGATTPTSLAFASAADKNGANAGTTNYIVSGVATGEFKGMRSYTLAANIILDVSGSLTITNYFSFSVNTTDTSTPPLFFAQQTENAILAWNYATDARGRIQFVNVALFAPRGGISAADAESYVKGATMNGFCVETYGPSQYAASGAQPQFLGVEDFATGRLMLYAQLQAKAGCSVKSVVFLNPEPMQSKCGIPAPPTAAELRKQFLQCAAQQALPTILDALKNMLKNSANQTVPTFENKTTASGSTTVTTVGTDTNKTSVTQKLRQRGAALLTAAASSIKDLSGSFEYDGKLAWALNFSAALGDIPGPTNLTAFQLLKRILEQCAPFIDVNINEGSVANPVVKASFSYSSETQLVDVRLTVMGMWMFGAAVGDVGQILDFNPADPANNQDTGPSISTRIVVDRVNGLRLLSLALQDMTIAQLAKKIGFSWPLSDDVVAISNPNILFIAPPGFVMEDGVELPTSLRVNVLLSIPGISLQNAVAGIVIQGRTAITLSVYGDCNPIPSFPAFIARSLSFSVSNQTGLTSTFLASLFQVELNATFNYNKGNITASLVGTNVQVVNIIKGIFSDVPIPGLILDLITPIKFSKVSITVRYNPALTTKKLQFTFSATPDISGTALLNAIKSLGLAPEDVSLDFKPGRTGANELAFGVQKTIPVNLPKPFTGPGACSFSIQVKGSNIVVYGAFQAAVEIPGADLPLNFSVGAGVAVGPSGSLLQIDAALLSPFSIRSFPWITLNSLSLSASIQIAVPPVLRSLVITGSQQILGATATQLFAFDTTTVPPVFALFLSVSNFNLQTALNQMGINVNLGPFNLLIREASFSYSASDVTVNGITVPMGVFARGSIVLFGMLDTTISLGLSPVGTSFSISVNATVLNQVLVKYILKPITDFLNAAADACRAGANAVGQAQKDANAALDKARADLQRAQDDVNTKLRALLDYRTKVTNELNDARVRAQNALNVFNTAKSNADQGVTRARAWLDQKSREFQAAMDNANNAFNSAQARVNQAQLDYDNWYRGATASLNNANNEVNTIQDKINCANDWSCNCFWFFGRRCLSCCPGYVVLLPGLYAALGVAKGVLWAAQKILDTLVTAAAYTALAAARLVLTAAQATVNAVARGAEWAARNAAELALTAAQNVANAVLSGTEWVARNAANAALTVAEGVANGVLTSTFYVASAAANATFAAAQGAVSAAQFTANAALDAVQGALNGIADGLKSIADPSWFQINAFSLGFEISKSPSKFVVSGSINVKLGSSTVNPSFSVDISNPLDIIKNFVKDLAIKAIKTLFPAAAKALP